jgi:hypothetical protein
MPALSYHKQFAPAVEAGRKLQTIRAMRKVPIKPGDTLYHYTGMRTKACRRLGVSTCRSANQIDIIRWNGQRGVFLQDCPGVGQRRLGNIEISVLAIKDGFPDVDSFYAWFISENFHFTGQLITWESITPF